MNGTPKEAVRDAANVRVPPPIIPLATVLVGVGLQRLSPLNSAFFPDPPLRYWLGAAVVAGAVLGLGAWSVVLFRRSGQSEIPWKPTPRIIDKGPYRITRNPMYLQMVLACVGFSLALANLWILLLTPLCGVLLQKTAIEPEEAYLERKFGQIYVDYKGRVRRWL